MGLAANLCHLPSNSFLQSVGGLLLSGGARGSPPPRRRPASLPASSPASPGPLSGSRAATHMVSCQIPAAPGDTCLEAGSSGGGLRNHRNGSQWEARAARGGGTERSRSRRMGRG